MSVVDARRRAGEDAFTVIDSGWEDFARIRIAKLLAGDLELDAAWTTACAIAGVPGFGDVAGLASSSPAAHLRAAAAKAGISKVAAAVVRLLSLGGDTMEVRRRLPAVRKSSLHAAARTTRRGATRLHSALIDRSMQDRESSVVYTVDVVVTRARMGLFPRARGALVAGWTDSDIGPCYWPSNR